MFSLGNTIRAKLALAAVVVAGALAVPSVASAVTASGCPSATDCVFVGGTGHNAATDTGGLTEFRLSAALAIVCTNARATVVTNGTDRLTVTPVLGICTAGGLGVALSCASSSLTLTSGGSGSGLGDLHVSPSNCVFSLGSGLCVIRTSNTVGGQDIAVGATGATGTGAAQLTAAISGNTDALTFSATGVGCPLLGLSSSGTGTFSNSPNSGPLVYDEVTSTSGGLVIS